MNLKENIFQNKNAKYQTAKPENWTGRETNPEKGNQYWYQEIELLDIQEITYKSTDFALIGYACDEGVRRNLGRIGAQGGPKILRERLAKLPLHFENKKVADVGDIICQDQGMEGCQIAFANVITELITNGIFPIAIGGGHDMAYGHYKGIKEALQNKTKNKLAIINFDAHFDLRPIEKQANSGTPFNQILSESNQEEIDYFAIGIQHQSNTKELFNIAKASQVEYAINYDCEASEEKIIALQNKLKPFIERNDYLYITIDLDGFSAAYAPGVSAPSPFGFTPYFVLKMLRFLLRTKKVISFDIAELNPNYDTDNLTSNLAAKLVDFVVNVR